MVEKKEELKEVKGEKGVYHNSNKEFGIFAGGFPKKQGEEWLVDCRTNYGDKRWLKMYSDHLKAKAYDAEKQVMDLKEVVNPPLPEDQEEEGVAVLGKTRRAV